MKARPGRAQGPAPRAGLVPRHPGMQRADRTAQRQPTQRAQVARGARRPQREVTGRRFPVPPVPPGALVRAGRALDTARRVVPLDSPMTEEAMALVTGWRGTEDCFDRLGVQLRDPRETLEVSLRAWRAAGLVTARQAGRAAGEHREGRARRPGLVERVKGVKVPGAVLASRPSGRWRRG